jgi:hypothetical protein
MRDPEVDKDIVPFLQVEFKNYIGDGTVPTFRSTDPAFSKYI